MKYTGITYRPPPEANSLLLQVTVGCAHNKCNYCTMYRDVKFKTEKIEQIEKDLAEAKALYGSVRRIFLVNGDAFVLSAKKLKIIAQKIIEYFPEIETITMYSAIRNIMSKSDEELKELRALRINDLWVGVETGNAEILESFNKGYSMDDTYEQLFRLNKAGIDYNCKLMLGTGGKGRAIEVARDTAKLINATKPKLVRVTALGFFEGTVITDRVKEGSFIPASELEVLREQQEMIRLIEAENTHFSSNHVINTVQIAGMLPRDKQRLIDSIDGFIATTDESFLNSTLNRSGL